MHAEHAHNEDLGGIESMIDMDAGFVDDEDSVMRYSSCRLSPSLQSMQCIGMLPSCKQCSMRPMQCMCRMWQICCTIKIFVMHACMTKVLLHA